MAHSSVIDDLHLHCCHHHRHHHHDHNDNYFIHSHNDNNNNSVEHKELSNCICERHIMTRRPANRYETTNTPHQNHHHHHSREALTSINYHTNQKFENNQLNKHQRDYCDKMSQQQVQSIRRVELAKMRAPKSASTMLMKQTQPIIAIICLLAPVFLVQTIFVSKHLAAAATLADQAPNFGGNQYSGGHQGTSSNNNNNNYSEVANLLSQCQCKYPKQGAPCDKSLAKLEDLICPPVVLNKQSELVVGVGSNVSLTCSARGTPPLIFVWFQDEKNITTSSGSKNSSEAPASTKLLEERRYEISEDLHVGSNGQPDVTTSTLYLYNLKATDTSFFLCWVENNASSTMANFTLTVDPNTAPIGFSDLGGYGDGQNNSPNMGGSYYRWSVLGGDSQLGYIFFGIIVILALAFVFLLAFKNLMFGLNNDRNGDDSDHFGNKYNKTSGNKSKSKPTRPNNGARIDRSSISGPTRFVKNPNLSQAQHQGLLNNQTVSNNSRSTLAGSDMDELDDAELDSTGSQASCRKVSMNNQTDYHTRMSSAEEWGGFMKHMRTGIINQDYHTMSPVVLFNNNNNNSSNSANNTVTTTVNQSLVNAGKPGNNTLSPSKQIHSQSMNNYTHQAMSKSNSNLLQLQQHQLSSPYQHQHQATGISYMDAPVRPQSMHHFATPSNTSSTISVQPSAGYYGGASASPEMNPNGSTGYPGAGVASYLVGYPSYGPQITNCDLASYQLQDMAPPTNTTTTTYTSDYMSGYSDEPPSNNMLPPMYYEATGGTDLSQSSFHQHQQQLHHQLQQQQQQHRGRFDSGFHQP